MARLRRLTPGLAPLRSAPMRVDRHAKQPSSIEISFSRIYVSQRPRGTVRIPLKANAFPEGSRTGFRDDSEHRSERSDAGFSIVQEVFGFVKMLRIRSVAEGPLPIAGKGCGERDAVHCPVSARRVPERAFRATASLACASNLPSSRCGERYERAGRGCRRPTSDRRSVHAIV